MKKVDQYKLKDALEHALFLINQEESEPEAFNRDEDPVIREIGVISRMIGAISMMGNNGVLGAPYVGVKWASGKLPPLGTKLYAKPPLPLETLVNSSIYHNSKEQSFNWWDEAPVICEINGYRWFLGQEADEEMTWREAVEWCKSVGGELPPRDILLQCFMNEGIRSLFKLEWYWSSAEFYAASAWEQAFTNGDQDTNSKNASNYVRAAKKVKI